MTLNAWRLARLSLSSSPFSLSYSSAFSSAAAAATIVPHTNVYDKYLKPKGGVAINRTLKLDDIIKREKMAHLSAGSIAEIWSEYHLSKPHCSSLVLTESTYAHWMGRRARESPSFVIPLRVANGGWLNYMVQHVVEEEKSCYLAIYTRLHDYQQWGDGAPIRMVTHAFPDLAKEKGIALTRSAFDGEALNRQQADALLKTTIDYYAGGNNSDSDYGWVWQFNHEAAKFNFEAFLSHHSTKHLSPSLQ